MTVSSSSTVCLQLGQGQNGESGRGFVTKVSDFGLSELFTAEGPLMGELGGTVTHLAPEIVTCKRVRDQGLVSANRASCS